MSDKVRIRGRFEKQDEQWVCQKAFELYGVENIKVGHSGWPDRQYLIPGGRPLWLEHKRPGMKAQARQAWRIRRLKELGYNAELADDRDEALEQIRRAVEAAQISGQGRATSHGQRSPDAAREPRRRKNVGSPGRLPSPPRPRR